jgi:enamine deaminase RidA (YjgF/YER057c/UK114 family)
VGDRGAAREHHVAPEGMAPGNGYSHVVAATGRFVAVAGQVALDENGAVVGEGDPGAQAERAFENLRLALAAVGANFSDVVKFTYFLTDVGMLPAVRAVRNRYIDVDRPPASTAVQVSALFRPEMLLEVEAIAIL